MNRAVQMAGLVLAWLAGGVGPAAGAVYIDGTNFAQRSAAFLRHCATAKPRREDYQAAGSPALILQHGGVRRTYDFSAWQVSEAPAPPVASGAAAAPPKEKAP